MAVHVDFQTHTRHSDDCGWMRPERLVAAAVDASLDAVAITDHNTMAGVEAARRAAPDDLHVVPGEEVDTPTGQVIGLFLHDPIEPWQSATDAVDAIHAQGGIAFAPHPFDALREGLDDVDAHVDELDAVETLNSRCVRSAYNDRAREFARTHALTELGGSDAHFPNEVGTARTVVDIPCDAWEAGDRNEAIVTAVERGDVRPTGGRGSLLNHVGTKTLKLYRRVH